MSGAVPAGPSRRPGAWGSVRFAAWMLRYAAARAVAAYVERIFLVAWLLPLLGVLLLFDDWRWAVLVFAAFAVLWLVKAALLGVLDRLGTPRRFRPAVEALGAARSFAVKGLLRELRRVGVRGSLVGLLGILRRPRVRQRGRDADLLDQIDFTRVFPAADLRRAREEFDRALRG